MRAIEIIIAIFVACLIALAAFVLLTMAGCTTAQKEQITNIIDKIPTATATPAPTATPMPTPKPTPMGQVDVDRSGFVATGDTVRDFCSWHGVEFRDNAIVMPSDTERQGYLIDQWCKAHGPRMMPVWAPEGAQMVQCR